MKKIILFWSVLFFIKSTSQTFEVVSILNSGTNDTRINIVILADGYQSTELDKFITDANSFTTAFFNQTPYKEYKNYFNVYAIKVISNESGASHPGTASDVNEPLHPVSVVDNFFGSSFDRNRIHRLLAPTKSSKITTVLRDNFPSYDQILVLVNTPFYGGSGGTNATTSLDGKANEIAIHEIGHSFSKLKDEYWAGDSYAAEGINMTKETSPTLVKWKNWYGVNAVGIYAHGSSGTAASWNRPHQNCMMRYLGRSFCPVCTEATIERIHTLTTPLLSYTPSNSSTLNGNNSSIIDFNLELIQTLPTNTIKVEWILNNALQANNDTEKFSLDTGVLNSGVNKLQANIRDLSTMLKVDNHSTLHYQSVLWTIDKSSLSILSVEEKKTKIDLFPNPATNELNIELNANDLSNYSITIYNLVGQIVLTQQSLFSNKTNRIDTSKLALGTYIVKVSLENGMEFNEQFIKN